MSDIRKYMNLFEGQFSGMVHSTVRGENVFVSYTIDGDQIEWHIDGMSPQDQAALGLTPEEINHIEEDCVEDSNFSF